MSDLYPPPGPREVAHVPIEATDRYVVVTPEGFTETFNLSVIVTLVRLGLIQHLRDQHVVVAHRDGVPVGVGPVHHFYGPVS